MALITKSDFSTYVQFTTNIPDRILDYHILKAEQMDFFPLVPEAFWTRINQSSPALSDDIQDFVDYFVKPLLIHFTILRFLVEHGRNITQYGVVVPKEDTSEPVTDTARNEIRNQYLRDTQVLLKNFYNELHTVEYSFEGVKYEFDCKTKQKKIMIKAV